jgi:leucyl-tRNA synthetase
MDTKQIEKKWTKKWQDQSIFNYEPKKGQKKFFGTFPYPYVNSYLHLGHFYSSMRLEALSRYKRMQGFNVLYAQSWHATGSPIVNAAKRIKDGEEKQTNILKMQGFSDQDIKKFEDPVEWVKYFPKEAVNDFTDMGYSIDWRRQFTTTDLNPHYDKFIRWQFRKLKEKGYVIKGKFPVVWDPVENTAVGDHARLEGEGEIPQEFILVKHKLDDMYLISATLRQDTILGITNLYVHPEIEYSIIETKGQKWILSEKAADNLPFQDYKIKKIGKIKGIELIGKKVEVVGGRSVLILPATFLDAEFGTGLVHSVPSDSADDLIALWDLQKDEERCKKYNLDINEVKNIKPIGVLNTQGLGDVPAQTMLEKYKVEHQDERSKLDKIKKELYKLSFYGASFNHLYKDFFDKNLEGVKVEEGKEYIKDELLKMGHIDIYYQLTGKVVARTLAECVVKIVDDQWFLAYGDEAWTKLAHECLDGMKLYPEKTRSQFNYVLDWLRNWACTRELGLGTKLPWDEKWLIESLSDSTIYMAFYTIYYKIKEMDPELFDDNFFDYVFLEKDVDVKIDKKLADELRDEFNYWYPMDFRNTGKDLIQNHMSFSIFNHIAIFPKKHWPVSYGLNGHVMVDGDKMSKSKGNFITMRQAKIDYGADASRFTALSGGEGIDDANFDRELAKSMITKLENLLEFAKEHYNKGRTEKLSIDNWFDNKINKIINETTEYYDETLFRSALQSCYFDLQNALKWYMRRCLNNPQVDTINRFIEVQTLLISPITPFIAEEIWEVIGKKELITLSDWPKPDKIINDKSEELIRSTITDINSVIKLAKLDKTNKITLFVSSVWKYELYKLLKNKLEETRDFKVLIGAVMQNENLKQHSKEITKIIQKVMKTGIDYLTTQSKEFEVLKQSKEFFENEFKSSVEIIKAEDSQENKAGQASPGKVAILVE